MNPAMMREQLKKFPNIFSIPEETEIKNQVYIKPCGTLQERSK